jgi:hypothetical protein
MSEPARPLVTASQLGYLCESRKRIVVPLGSGGAAADAGGTGTPAGFEIQDLARIDAQALGAAESWRTVLRGDLAPHHGPFGDYLVGDCSALRRPGCYRAVVAPGRGAAPAAWSWPFIVADGVFSRLPGMCLDFVHAQRCGAYEDELRGPCHLDDGVRSDTGEQIDAAGGWHDAGDLRKWMATTSLPILGFLALRDRLAFSRNHWREKHFEDDGLSEAAWGVRWVLKMQDPASGMFWEDVGGGGDSRREPGMQWWYENHAGCYADNAGNFYSDNRRSSGDERSVRAQYNPVVQYTAIALLLDAGDRLRPYAPALATQSHDSALMCWKHMQGRRADPFHDWTSVIAWRLAAALRLHAMGMVAEDEVTELVTDLLALQSERGFWYMDRSRRDPYRGILNAAQPVIALCSFIDSDFEHPLVDRARESLERLWDGYVVRMTATNPWGMMPYGLYAEERTRGDVYHELEPGLWYRFFMPAHAPERINHGLSAHWTSWAHGLGMMARVLERREYAEAAFDQLAWLMGANPLGLSMVTGVGHRFAAPYSRFAGPVAGGFLVGPRGTAEDEMWADSDGRMEWSSGEYWMAPLANALMALAELLPPRPPAGPLIAASRKLGAPTEG